MIGIHFANFDLDEDGHHNMATVITSNIKQNFIQPVMQIYENGSYERGLNYTHVHVKESTEFENDEEVAKQSRFE